MSKKIQTYERFKTTLFTRTKHNIQIFGLIPFTKLQNEKKSLEILKCTRRVWKPAFDGDRVFFGCPEVTLCGQQDIKNHLLTSSWIPKYHQQLSLFMTVMAQTSQRFYELEERSRNTELIRRI